MTRGDSSRSKGEKKNRMGIVRIQVRAIECNRRSIESLPLRKIEEFSHLYDRSAEKDFPPFGCAHFPRSKVSYSDVLAVRNANCHNSLSRPKYSEIELNTRGGCRQG